MRASDSSMGGAANQFHTTCWTLAVASVQNQSQLGRTALARLCRKIGRWRRRREDASPPLVQSGLGYNIRKAAFPVSSPADIENGGAYSLIHQLLVKNR